ncbi:AIPR family protein [Trichococcus collinsii]|uniref:AIPR protein n=1 Tax=Trichococcus collinsii TaxID=157076 RepID=A0AB37ZX64_9LACT|nr:AIPR family protein [Trichococcus collinsii]CZQ80413.1 abortive bacteriophage infection resistance [Trichococcus collinsii]SDZ92803.1 AIPR protein [Trichococcus collinsii]
MKNDVLKPIPYKRIVNLESPYEEDNRTVYHAWVDVRDLPEGIPTEVNPREVNVRTKVYGKLKSALTSSDESFFVHNRGLLISAKDLKIDTLNRVMNINIGNLSDEDKSIYGVLDGGHTYHAILTERGKIDDSITQYVHLEIMTHVRNIDEMAAARNTSVQVSDKAIAELAEKFDFVKVALSSEPYKDDISYRENESDKRLDSVDFVRLMYCFNVFKFPTDSNKQPIAAYSGKAQVLKDYLTDYGRYETYTKIAPLLPVITKLYDAIEQEMHAAYLEVTPGGQFGRVKGVDDKENGTTTKFYQWPIKYQISQGLIFPIIAAFRGLVTEENGTLAWEVDPLQVWSRIKSKLVNNTVEMSRQLGNNPQSAGKSGTLWSQNLDAVNTAKLQLQLEKLRSK